VRGVTYVIPNDFDPRPYQRRYMRYFTDGGSDGRGKRAAWCVHRRGGKDLTALHTTAMLMHRRVGVYWHVFPTAEQGKKAIWTEFRSDGKRIMENVFPKWMRKSPKDFAPSGEMIVELKCGSIWRLMGSDKIEVVGAGPVGVVFSEFALAKPSTWELVSPMLRANSGWAAFISTPRGNNHFKREFDTAGREPGWFRDIQTVHDTGQTYASTRRPGQMIGPNAMIEEEIASGRQASFVRQEYECDWTAANVGAVWGDLIETLEKNGAIAEFDFDRKRVFSTWDLGGSGAKGDATCFWLWAPTPDGADVLDYYENHGKTLEHYWDEMARREAAIGVRAVRHWLPHDARAKHLTGVSVLEQSIKHWGAERVAIYPEDNLLNGIQAGRWLLQRPVRFHPRCSEGIEALKAYHYEFDEDRNTLSNQPEHDWSSHAADGFRGLSLVVKRTEAMSRPEPPPEDLIAKALKQPTLDELFAYQPQPSGRI
jgi:phage terminase large subunit